jgi:hypothetical protein
MSEQDITLGDWLQEQMNLLQMFAMWYRAMSRMDPEQFPERMPPEHWDEYAQTFDPSVCGEE